MSRRQSKRAAFAARKRMIRRYCPPRPELGLPAGWFVMPADYEKIIRDEIVRNWFRE